MMGMMCAQMMGVTCAQIMAAHVDKCVQMKHLPSPSAGRTTVPNSVKKMPLFGASWSTATGEASWRREFACFTTQTPLGCREEN